MPDRSIESFFSKTTVTTSSKPANKRKSESLDHENGAESSKSIKLTVDADTTEETRVKLVDGEPVAETDIKHTARDAATGAETTSTAHWSTRLSSLLPVSWQKHLAAEFTKPYFATLCRSLLEAETKQKKLIFPPHSQIFAAFEHTPFESVKVCIIGQDPYHDNNQAHGLAFSVPHGQKVPSSLQNIYKELSTDIEGFVKPKHGNLTKWADQGVLLLNTSLTVEAHRANSHKAIGWEKFTDAVITAINKDLNGVVFVLWGNNAQAKAKNINLGKHSVLKSVHPSGLSASKGFFGSKPFSKCNQLLVKHGKTPVDWKLDP